MSTYGIFKNVFAWRWQIDSKLQKGESTIWSMILWVSGSVEVKIKDATAPIDLPQSINLW